MGRGCYAKGESGLRSAPGSVRVPAEPWCLRRSVWTRLQDIHEALGLRHQWGGSHGNKVLLACLGIDTRNIVSPESGGPGSRVLGQEDPGLGS